MHKNAEMGSHKISYDVKTGVHKAGSDDAIADAHKPNRQAGIESYRLSPAAKTGAHKAVSGYMKPRFPETRKRAEVKAQKESHDKKTGTRKTVKKGFIANIEEETRKNRDFLRVLSTGKNCRIVMIRLKPMEDIGLGTHDDVDQFFRFEEGQSGAVSGPE